MPDPIVPPPAAPPVAPPPAPEPTYTRSEIDSLIAKLTAPTPPAPAPAPAPAPPKPAPVADKVSAQEITALRQLRAKLDEIAQGRAPEEVLADYDKYREQSLTAQERADGAEAAQKALQTNYTALQVKYENSVIERDVMDAAVPKASTPAAAKLIHSVLRETAKLGADGKVTYGLTVQVNGQPVAKRLTAAEAVAHLEGQTGDFGPLFKSFASSGSGAQANDNRLKDPTTGQFNLSMLKGMSMEEFNKFRNENSLSSVLNTPLSQLIQ